MVSGTDNANPRPDPDVGTFPDTVLAHHADCNPHTNKNPQTSHILQQ